MSSSVPPPRPARKSRLERIGCWLSERVADVSAHPFAQVGLILLCGLWYAAGFDIGILTAILSILAITLSQMVLNRQAVRETEAHRRDVALHAKLDELVLATREARDEIAGVEELEEQEIEELRRAKPRAEPRVRSDAGADGAAGAANADGAAPGRRGGRSQPPELVRRREAALAPAPEPVEG